MLLAFSMRVNMSMAIVDMTNADDMANANATHNATGEHANATELNLDAVNITMTNTTARDGVVS